MKTQLPRGPRMPAALQSLGSWSRPTAFPDRCRARYGKRFTIQLLGRPPFVVLCDPDEIKEVLTAPPEVLHPGEGSRVPVPLVGRNSVLLLDEAPHLKQRKLLLPAFHGERMRGIERLMRELTDRELTEWPRAEPIELHPHLQRLTLEIVLRAVFGLERGAHLDELRELLSRILAFGDSPLSLLPQPTGWLERLLRGRGPLGRLEALLAQADGLIFALIDEHRREGGAGTDVLALLLAAEHEDGTPMSPAELRDELMTALIAGHETTASQLAWAFMHLAREPTVCGRLTAELDAGTDDAYLTATIHEVMRRRPVIPNASPRLVKRPVEIGGVRYPPGVALVVGTHLVHHDPDIYPDPYAFRPERFLERAAWRASGRADGPAGESASRETGGPVGDTTGGYADGRAPSTYTWLPFGGGRRRCIGASFALLEMKVVLSTVLGSCELEAVGTEPEAARRRNVTISPSRGAQVVLHERSAAA